MPIKETGKLSLFQQFICCLMKLRLNCPGPFLASMFDMATSNVSRMFLFKVVSTNGHRPTGLDNLARARKFAENNAGLFSRVVWEKKSSIFFDCFEIFIEHPSNLQARTSTWSNYKHKTQQNI